LNEDGVAAAAIVGGSLLGAVAVGVLAGIGDDLSVGSEEMNFGDVWAGVGECRARV
jgi:hypothetical protein